MVKLIETTKELKIFCEEALGSSPYITIDTEFLREKTYYAQLCLIQLAFVGDGVSDAAIVDVQARDIDLSPLGKLYVDKKILKVFHAARQDLEILFSYINAFPTPFFDTQVAAMVCGFGDQVGYETLVKKLVAISIDKSSRFTNWSKRPLSNQQLNYAISDVTHLRTIYEALQKMLRENGRSDWLNEELSILLDEKTYENCPSKAWHKIRTKNVNHKFLSVVKSLAAFRENQAKKKNVPRNNVFRDEAIIELASVRPSELAELKTVRLLREDYKRGSQGEKILAAVRKPLLLTETEITMLNKGNLKKNVSTALLELLKVLLKAKSDESGVAQKLIASTSDLESLASGMREILPVLKGWRYDVFGRDALRLINGEIALSARGSGIKLLEISK